MAPSVANGIAVKPTAPPDDHKTVQDDHKLVQEIRIGSRHYDITEFRKRHPGGNIIAYYLGQDATEAFNAFHPRSTRVHKVLPTVPSRPVEQDQVMGRQDGAQCIKSRQETDPLVADFEKLRLDLYREGYFEPDLWHVTFRLVEIIVSLYAAYLLIQNQWIYTGLLLLGIGGGRCGWLAHEAGHNSVTGNMAVDHHFQSFLYGMSMSIAASFWNNQHNRHHASPQKLKHDVDLRTLPLVAFHSDVAKDGSPLWLRWQAVLYMPIITFLVGLAWMLVLNPWHAFRTGHYLELFYCVFLRYWFNFCVLYAGFTWRECVWMELMVIAIGSAYLLTNFTLSHTHKPVLQPDEHTDWVRYSANHTINIHPSWWCDWWMGFLNYQIEHHLFPTMPQFRNPMIAPRVKALFEKHGLEYDVRSYVEAVRATFANLHAVGQSVSQKAK